jgi:hypothetical protein
MYNSIPQKEYRIPLRGIRETNRTARDFNARACGIAYTIGDSNDLKDILRIIVRTFLIPQKGCRIPQKRKNEL